MSASAIRLHELVKRFPGQRRPAVDGLSLDVPSGAIVVLVGPSGCGKSTTLRLINRLIEPTSGRIEIDGEDVTTADPDALRRRIGYVIQQIGLFPHMTVAENVATVPQMLGWERSRIAERVDELLTLVGLDPDEYRGRYPKELSGGQGQRVGVARAMAADPPVLLMDEPFGAIDPITRERLQDEFLRLQAEIRKTIVFVTHDIDEAVKMGDRIAILRPGAEIAQYDTPARVLTAPADGFVAEFVGAGALVRGLTLARVRDVELDRWPTVDAQAPADGALASLRSSGHAELLVVEDGRPRGWVGAAELGNGHRVGEVARPLTTALTVDRTLHEALDALIESRVGAAPVVDERGAYLGMIELPALSAAVAAMRDDDAGP